MNPNHENERELLVTGYCKPNHIEVILAIIKSYARDVDWFFRNEDYDENEYDENNTTITNISPNTIKYYHGTILTNTIKYGQAIYCWEFIIQQLGNNSIEVGIMCKKTWISKCYGWDILKRKFNEYFLEYGQQTLGHKSTDYPLKPHISFNKYDTIMLKFLIIANSGAIFFGLNGKWFERAHEQIEVYWNGQMHKKSVKWRIYIKTKGINQKIKLKSFDMTADNFFFYV